MSTSSFLQQAEATKLASLTLPAEIARYLELFASRPDYVDAYQVLLTLALYKLEYPEIDLHNIPYSASGADLYHKVVAPYITSKVAAYQAEHSQAAQAPAYQVLDQAWLLASFAPEDYVDVEGKMDPGHFRRTFYALLEYLSESLANAQQALAYLLQAPAYFQEHPQELKVFDEPAQINKFARIQRFLDILHARLAEPGMEQHKEMIVYYAYYTCYLDHLKHLPEYQGYEISAPNLDLNDPAPGTSGYIRISKDGDTQVKEVVEVRYVQPVTKASMQKALEYCQAETVPSYHIFSKQGPLKEDALAVAELLTTIKGQTASEVAINYLCTSLEYHLNLVADLDALEALYAQVLATEPAYPAVASIVEAVVERYPLSQYHAY